MQIVILSVGKKSEQTIESLIDQYEKRLGREYQITWQFVPASRSADERICRREDSEALSKYIKDTDSVVLLDERGQQFDNKAFADVFEGLATRQGRTVIVIGGAYGVTDEFRNTANVVWSLSNLVFPHRLIRLIVMEQLYRTIMITKGHPYHHE